MTNTASPPWTEFLPLDDRALLAQCQQDRFRASGPGGQKRNKTDSAVRLRHQPSGVQAEAVESRSQHENRARALRRLRLAIALHLRAPVDLEGYEPPPALREAVPASEKRSDQGKRRGPRGGITMGRRDARYPTVIAALFDLLEACAWRISDAATHLGVSTASIGRFLEQTPEVFRAANERRQALGLPPLRAGR